MPALRRLSIAGLALIVGLLPLIGGAALSAASAATGSVAYVGGASTAGNRTAHRVTAPSTVKAGDLMLLALTTNSTNGSITTPSGWNLIQSQNGTGIRMRVYSRTAVAADASKAFTVTSSAQQKDVTSIAVYRSTSNGLAGGTVVGNATVSNSASAVTNTAATSATAPNVSTSDTGWLVHYFAGKSSSTPTWSVPGGMTRRASSVGSGSGNISASFFDTNANVTPAGGSVPGRTSTASASVSRNTRLSVVVKPGSDTVTNQPPVAAYTYNCTGLTCDFDASTSSDPENATLTYSWNFGDGTPADTTQKPSHTFAAAGTKTVTLTVNDGTLGNSTSKQVTTSVPATGTRPKPGHTAVVPSVPRTNIPKISNGEIWDFARIGNTIYVAGSFTSASNTAPNGTATFSRTGLMSFDLNTGAINQGFNPVFAGGTGVENVEATPDGTKLFVVGSFNSVNGNTTKHGVVSLNPTTGAVVTGFTANTDARATNVVASNSTVYIGGLFSTVNGAAHSGLAAVNASTGAVDPTFQNDLSGGIGVNGALGVQQMVLSHDMSRLVVVHTGRQVNGHDRYGVAIIDLPSNQLDPWRTRLWQDNLQFVGGIQRAYGGDIAPNDQYFVVTSGSGGDRPPINDTVTAFSFDPGNNPDDVQPLWISRHFDSIYSAAITEKAVYLGGHFSWQESPTAPDPWPGLDNVGYGTGQGLSGYGLGDAVVNRFHLGALNPADGKASGGVQWNPWSNSAEGNKAMLAIPEGLIVGGDAGTTGGMNVGRLSVFDFRYPNGGATQQTQNGVDTTISSPMEGQVVHPDQMPFSITGNATAAAGVQSVSVTVKEPKAKLWLNNQGQWQSTAYVFAANVANVGATSTGWSVPVTVAGDEDNMIITATARGGGVSDNVPATKRFETFNISDLPPDTSISAPSSGLLTTHTFTVNGTVTDDIGVRYVTYTVKDPDTKKYLQDDGTASTAYNSFTVQPDVVNAKNTTWSTEITVPYDASWMMQVDSVDTGGNSQTDTTDRTWQVVEGGTAPTVSISSPTSMVPPTQTSPITVAPGSPMTFSGTANDDEALSAVAITLSNSATREKLAADGTWGTDVVQGFRIISPPNLNSPSYNWSYTTPFNLSPGVYTFYVLAADNDGVITPSVNYGILTVNVQVPGDAPPDTKLDPPVNQGCGTNCDQSPNSLTGFHLTGTATDDKGVKGVKVSVFEQDSGQYVQPNGTLGNAYATLPTTLGSQGATSTTWSLTTNLPKAGDYSVAAIATDTVDQTDLSASGATARYLVYPGDADPTLEANLFTPLAGTQFTDSKILVSGRADDDVSMRAVQVAIQDSNGKYMNGSGSFGNNENWRTAFLNSPGSPGSNYSFTTPTIPAGNYTVKVRAVDGNDQIGPVTQVGVSVSAPPGNNPPTANFTKSCNQNVCSFDGTTSTDENAPTLSYSWNFGQGSGSGPKPTKTYTSAGTFTITLTVTDEYGATGTTTQTVTINEPAGNVAPTPVINPPSCNGLVCNFSAVGTTDPNTGDSISYSWSFGDGGTSTAAAVSHTFPSGSTYTVQLTATDGWGKSSSTSRQVTVP